MFFSRVSEGFDKSINWSELYLVDLSPYTSFVMLITNNFFKKWREFYFVIIQICVRILSLLMWRRGIQAAFNSVMTYIYLFAHV